MFIYPPVSATELLDLVGRGRRDFFGGGSSFNDGTTQTVLDPLGRGPVRTHGAVVMPTTAGRERSEALSLSQASEPGHMPHKRHE